jgi:pimeloyl-ACP methyl ester carboxylesterase
MPADLPIVLVPGLGSSVRNHLAILPTLWRYGSVFVANQTRDDTVAAMAARALSEAPPKFSLIGHSLGGYIVLEMIRQAPERVARLALLNTSARLDTPEATALRHERIAETRAGRYAEMQAKNFPLSVHPDRVDDPALIEMSRLTREDSGPDAFIRQQTAIMARIDSRPFLKDIRVPTLVLSGDQDRLISNEFSKEMASLIPGAKLVIVPNCGHLAPAERPEATAAALDAWLRQPL